MVGRLLIIKTLMMKTDDEVDDVSNKTLTEAPSESIIEDEEACDACAI